jgi:tRNA threonylcarbamoyladenosine biosynthesis protein TsaE
MDKTFITNNREETLRLGEEYSKIVEKGGTILLFGDLGAGKTTFVQVLANGLKIKRRITSPTFIIVRSYPEKKFYHVDLYRIESANDLEALGLKDLLKDRRNILAIEWPEKVKDIIFGKVIRIKFEYVDENKRKIVVSS